MIFGKTNGTVRTVFARISTSVYLATKYFARSGKERRGCGQFAKTASITTDAPSRAVKERANEENV